VNHKHHTGCCGCSTHGIDRRTFFAAIGGSAAGASLLSGCATTGATDVAAAPRVKPVRATKTLIVQPVLSCSIAERQEMTSWRGWGGLHSMEDINAEMGKIGEELNAMKAKAEFPMELRPLVKSMEEGDAKPLVEGDADVMLIYGAAGQIEPLISGKRSNIVFVRHQTGPAYLWYEIVSPRLIRKTVDEFGQPGLLPEDVVVDDYGDLLWRLRALYGLKNTVGSKIVCIGGASGWGEGGQKAPQACRDIWKMDLKNFSYDELGRRIQSANNDPARVRRAVEDAAEYLNGAGVKLETGREYVERAFLLTQVFEDILAEEQTQAITVNNCMSTIMPMSKTTACLTLSLLNDSGALAFCESDFVVIPSGILLHHIAQTPVFLNDPTYPHHGKITLAHCTAPRRNNGKDLDEVLITTHFESDFGAAPKVAMKLGQKVTVIDPDFNNKRWIGFTGEVLDNPFLDICRSQVDVSIEGDWKLLAQDMVGFHWMMSYGDHLREFGYALRKTGIGWLNLTANQTIEA
jgi:hypothetical protein